MSEPYRAFLQTKRMVAPSGGMEVSAEALHPRLFPFQRALVQWALRKGRAALFADCGLGKTSVQLAWANAVHQHTGGDLLLLAPLAVAGQTIMEAEQLDLAVQLCRSQSDVRPGLNITNYEMMGHFDPTQFLGVVLDECFAPDTLIDTPRGRIPLYALRVGDAIFNASGIDTIADLHRKEVPFAVRVTVRGTAIISSPNHPYFTQRGWVGAQDLLPGDAIMESSQAMRLVYHTLFPEASLTQRSTVLRDILRSEMAHEPARDSGEIAHARDCQETRREAQSLAGVGQARGRGRITAVSRTAANGTPRSAPESLPPVESYRPQTFRAWGQWAGDDQTATALAGGTWRRMESGICLITGSTHSWLSDALQARSCPSRAQNCSRSGWQLPLQPQGARSEERCEAGFVGVDGLEILEPGHPALERLRDAEGRIYLYDLGATRHPSFSVNGLLVHNSSILKSYMGKTKRALVEAFASTPYRLCCTATPAPNDVMEMGNHSEFLGVMPSNEMLMRWFLNDTMSNGRYRLKGHATKDFWAWVASWAISMRKPSDLGYPDDGFVLPELHLHHHYVQTDLTVGQEEGQLFRAPRMSAANLHKEMRLTAAARAQAVVDLVAARPGETWAIWCYTNYEADELVKRLPDALEVRGSESVAEKERKLLAFVKGEARILITKPGIAGYGLNFQHCHHTAFVGLSYSFEDFYQAVRRFYRFGQQQPVEVIIVAAETEAPLVAALERKIRAHVQMSAAMTTATSSLTPQEELHLSAYEPQVLMRLPSWLETMHPDRRTA